MYTKSKINSCVDGGIFEWKYNQRQRNQITVKLSTCLKLFTYARHFFLFEVEKF